MIKARHWNGKDLEGSWLITYKIDGIRALWDGSKWISRNEKILNNIPIVNDLRDIEVYLGDFRTTQIAISTEHFKEDTPIIKPEHLYSLDPLDDRLFVKTIFGPSADEINSELQKALDLGFEGLVLRSKDIWLKVKPEKTYDLRITGSIEGNGRHVGRLGSLITERGKVGTGFTDEERNDLWSCRHGLVGRVVEVTCMQLTKDGMMRHPRFIRMRPDKD